MAKDYIDPSDIGFFQQLTTFQTVAPTYAAILGLTSAQLASHANDTAYFGYVIAILDLNRNTGTQWTSWRDTTRDGGDSGTAEADLPAYPAPVAPVLPGIEPRFRALCNLIKAHPAYNEAMGKALGIVAETTAAPDLTTIQPVITAAIRGNEVRVGWGWGKNAAFLDQCEIQVDRADGKGFILLTHDTTPNYIDTHPLPATPAKWTYKAIYRVNDRPIGQWGNPVTLLVQQG